MEALLLLTVLLYNNLYPPKLGAYPYAFVAQVLQLASREESLQRELEAADKAIDELVYDLYSLTEDAIRIVEERDAKP